ncbi:aminotransferase class III-fold pyridoxal phosphate-dependent enzyme, partial [Falsihalocynthiibacter sp. CO-5D18]|uniref:aminotransferase class III-fold pyridoxal phosphate-dependent enzyme n=1 Tax=Falsihalocynthiibacter sp. CO-5D18 TaxID=3240872 RepID=UPI003510BEDB
LLCDLSGEELSQEDAEATFLDLGFDSLFLGQVAQKLGADFGIDITFRQLLSQYPTATAVAGLLDENLPPDVVEAVAPVAAPQMAEQVAAFSQLTLSAPVTSDGRSPLMLAQISAMQTLFSQQLLALSGTALQQVSAAPVTAPAPAPMPEVIRETAATAHSEPVEATPKKPAFSIGRATNAGGGDLTPQQAEFARDLAQRYSAKSPKTKAYVQRYRPAMADPRTAAGFRAEWKELVFPVVCDRSKGSRLWDIDGNEFIDLVNGFGQTAFGHSPDFVVDAITRQMERGFAIGPQSDLAGPIAERFARFVGHQRAAFCNTGSEAVMAAMRIARTVTGREKIVVFGNDYHGQFDEVLVKGKRSGGDPAALPIAPGIPRASLSQMVVLPYAEQSTLDWLRKNIGDIAAVIVEPVQSRHPDLRPRAFVETLRELTRDGGAAMVMDEVVTGFRVGPRGMQGAWDITPDMATYGKVVGGGMPIGMLAGSDRFMDALDGGQWQFGDESVPEASPTFFAGTFVRHPLVLAAVEATLDHMEQHGADLWEATADLTARTVRRLNDILDARGLPRIVETFSSWFVPQVTDLDPNAALLFPLMRLAGVHVQIGYPCIFTTAHTQDDADKVVTAFEQSVDALRAVGILGGNPVLGAEIQPAATAQIGLPLTAAQREIWMTTQLVKQASCCFNESVSLELSGPLDLPALQRAMDQIIARHDGLRMVFARNGESFDVVDPYPLPLELHDVSTSDDPASALHHLLLDDAATPIDIVSGPPLRAFVVRTSQDTHVLVLNAHHIVCDGWSFNVLSEELATLYAQEVTGKTAGLPPAPSFASFAKQQAAASVSEKTRAYWKTQFQDIPELPELPTDRPRPEIKTFAGATCTAHISGDVMRAARKAGAEQGCTLFSTLFAALNIAVARLTGASDIVLGVPTGGQAMLANSDLVGHCVNFLPIRQTHTSDLLASDFLKQVSEGVMDAFDHQDYTYGTLVQDLNVARSLNRLPLTEIQFNLEKLSESIEMGPLRATMHPNAKAAVNFDLFFNIVERKDGLRVDVDYNADVFEASTVLRWVGHLEQVLAELGQNTARPIAQLPVLSEQETVWLAETLNATETPMGETRTIHGRFAEACEKHGDAIAIKDSAGQTSYSVLAQRSDSIAASLQAAGIKPQSRVAVALPRSSECIVTLLGVMKAGCAYVPIDLNQPDTRLRMILENADVSAIVHQGNAVPSCADGLGLAALQIDAITQGGTPENITQTGDAAAYVMFTSGSTGTPKGVEIGHGSVVNLLTSMAKDTAFNSGSSLLSVTTIMFDISVLEMFMP